MTDMTRREFARAGVAGAAGFSLQRSPAGGENGYRYVHLDVFTDQRLAGNQLLVYTEPGSLTPEQMQALTRESNYSENTFVFHPEQPGTEYRIRIFTRT